MFSAETGQLIAVAISEDIGSGDITSELLIPVEKQASAVVIARQPLVLAGQEVAREVVRQVDPSVVYEATALDGAHLNEGDECAVLCGPLRSILSAERTVLNFLQRLCGISTLTAAVVAQAEPHSIRILDTRKTTPGWRQLEKYAVRVGGGENHRHGLFDAVLIKNNHIDALEGDVALAIQQARKGMPPGMLLEVEVRSIEELQAALAAGPDRILLDNMERETIQTCVAQVQAHSSTIEIEVSGGVTPANLQTFLVPGVDYISLGAITHSAIAVDLSLRFKS